MKILSVRPPWAGMIVSGEKRIENRTWSTKVRGRIGIHRCGPGGGIIGTVKLIDILSPEDALEKYPDQARHIQGPRCWVFTEPVAMAEEIGCKGSLRLWEFP